MAARAHEAALDFHTHAGALARDRAYVDAFREGRPPPRRPRVHDLERYAPDWAHLVPDDPDARAELAHAMAGRHRLSRRHTPRIQAALGLDDPAVAAAYAARHKASIDQLFTERLSVGERVRWIWCGLATSLERLPAFWLITVLTVTVSLPVGLLGLPVAAAEIGPLPALAMLAIVGTVMSITMGALGETIARSGDVRYKHGFLGGLASTLIGSRGSGVLSGAAGLRTTLALLAGWLGLSITMSELTDTPRGLWSGVILVGVIFMLGRGAKLALTTVSLLGVAATVLVVAASVLALFNAGAGDLSHTDVPFGGGNDALDGTVGAALGVILMEYIGSVYLIGIYRAGVPKDANGRTLASGAFVGTVIVTLIVGLWLLGASAAVPAEELKSTAGTAMGPLADQVGPIMVVIGGVASFLLLGMNINRASTAVHELALERLSRLKGLAKRLVALIPVLLVFAVAEISLDLGDASFSSVLTIAGVVTNLLVGAAIPMLMVLAARRRGELVPPVVWRWLGAPWLVWVIVVVAIGTLALVGLFVWDDWGSRTAALAMAVVGALTVWWAFKADAFKRRGHVELFDSRWAVVAAGRPLEVEAELDYGDGDAERVRASGGAVKPGLQALRVQAADANGAPVVDAWSADGEPVAEVSGPDGDGSWSASVSPRKGSAVESA